MVKFAGAATLLAAARPSEGLSGSARMAKIPSVQFTAVVAAADQLNSLLRQCQAELNEVILSTQRLYS